MPIRNYKPTSPGRRQMTVQTYDDLTTDQPYRPQLSLDAHPRVDEGIFGKAQRHHAAYREYL